MRSFRVPLSNEEEGSGDEDPLNILSPSHMPTPTPYRPRADMSSLFGYSYSPHDPVPSLSAFTSAWQPSPQAPPFVPMAYKGRPQLSSSSDDPQGGPPWGPPGGPAPPLPHLPGGPPGRPPPPPPPPPPPLPSPHLPVPILAAGPPADKRKSHVKKPDDFTETKQWDHFKRQTFVYIVSD
ncbi:hypothetical protein PILCRDRAFT_3492 [Piloderma croceum F 1598]|uniref:Uncharacterized protein n=1 Tax=Piloderma croceum (strain F 1598) TaxID=765440 RepID=A0A0C3FTR5_PILCF|nr:hypothetical protein PILCRDRAFT_3492 [Piloderma croceum F 1598]